MLHLWVELLLLANHKKTKIFIGSELVKIDKGDVITSLSKLATLLNCSTKKITTALKTFEKDKMIINKKAKKWTHLTICNYETYQGSGNAEETVRKRRGNAEETVRKTIKNDKNDKNVKEEKKYMSIWNIFADKHKLSKIKILTKERKAKLKVRANSIKNFEELFLQALEEIPKSNFLLGDTGWQISFDWIISNDTNIYKIIEGKYKNEKPKSNGKLPTTIDPKTDYSIPTDRGHGYTT